MPDQQRYGAAHISVPSLNRPCRTLRLTFALHDRCVEEAALNRRTPQRPLIARLISCALVLVASAAVFGISSADPKGSVVTRPRSRPISHGVATGAGSNLPGQPMDCFDIQTGATVEFRARHLFSSGALDDEWAPDTTQRCAGSANGLSEQPISDGQGGTYYAWVDSRGLEPDIYLQHLTATGDTCVGWPRTGRAVCMARLSQYNLNACSDGAGGALLTWQDYRDGKSSVAYVQRMTFSGAAAEGWPGDGLSLGRENTQQFSPHVASDGSGGALILWQERESEGLALRAQHVSSAGAIAGGWPAEGTRLLAGARHISGVSAVAEGVGQVRVFWRETPDSTGGRLMTARINASNAPDSSWSAQALALATGTGIAANPMTLQNGDGGLVAAWTETNGATEALRVVRLTNAGTVATGWPANGAVVISSGMGLSTPALLPDGTGGAIIAWEDRRSGIGHISAQRFHGDGTTDSLWSQGVSVCTSPGEQHAPMLSADGNGGVIASWVDDGSQPQGGTAVTQAFLDALPQFVRAETNSGYARVVWTAGGLTGVSFHAYRSARSGELTLLATLAPDDSSHLVLEDRAAPPGNTAEYRLSVETAGDEYFLVPVKLAIPLEPTVLLLQRVWPSRGRDGFEVAFALPRGPVPRVDVLDVMGRRMGSESLTGFAPGYHQAHVRFTAAAPSGVYFLRLSQGAHASVRKVVFTR
jgi:hypothetical protein